MKKSIRLLLLALSISLILSFTVGCSSKKSESRYDTAPAEKNSTDDYMPNSVSVQDSSKSESNLLEPEK